MRRTDREAGKAAGRSLIGVRRITGVLFLAACDCAAFDNASLDIGSLNTHGFKLENVRISLRDIAKPAQQLGLTIETLTLPQPFADLKLAEVHCSSFSWGEGWIVCDKGRAKVDSKQWRSPMAGFSFRLGEKASTASIYGLKIFGGTVTAELSEAATRWEIKLSAKHLDAAKVASLLGTRAAEVKAGELAFTLLVSGTQTEADSIDLTTRIEQLTLQTPNGTLATETLSVPVDIHADRIGHDWRWTLTQQLESGALYFEPVYLEAGREAVSLNGKGIWHDDLKRLDIDAFEFDHAGIAHASGRASVAAGATTSLQRAEIRLKTERLAGFFPVYLKPFLEATSLEGLDLEGRAAADLDLKDAALDRLAITLQDLAVRDANGRLSAVGGSGGIHWSNRPEPAVPSILAWQKLNLFSLPIGPAGVSFSLHGNRVELLRKARLPFLDGSIALERFAFAAHAGREPDVAFEGRLNRVSLERLTAALNWTPLSGTLSGRIPAVEYRDNLLKLDGELNIRVFDGNVTIANLASSGLFGDYPLLSADIALDRLDLDQITRKFEFGGITGRLSGTIKNLAIEAWRPVGFYAWFGTPENDDLPHRISQKAVQNIASIGGGGAADLLSRSMLRFFDTFGYDKIGIGCYLHEGVCQMMGVEAAPQGGYRIIKGGGLPRIDVIGYNPKVDWAVLIERLKRVTASDEVIIQ